MTLIEAPADLYLRGACRGMDPEAFALDPNPNHEAQAEALAACGRCPVRETCLDWGKQIRGIGFIWGGSALLPERKENDRTSLTVEPPRSCRRCRRLFAPARLTRSHCSDRCSRARNGYQGRLP